MANDASNILICYQKLHFNQHSILWIKSTTKPRKTDIERILMKPQYAMGLDLALLLFLRNFPDRLICTWGMYLK